MTLFGGKSNRNFIEAYFIFHLKLRASHLNSRSYSEYQYFLYEKITKFRKIGWSSNKIANWFNKGDFLTSRGKKFKGSHVHSIMQKKNIIDKRITQEFTPKIYNFRIRFIDNTLINFLKK